MVHPSSSILCRELYRIIFKMQYLFVLKRGLHLIIIVYKMGRVDGGLLAAQKKERESNARSRSKRHRLILLFEFYASPYSLIFGKFGIFVSFGIPFFFIYTANLGISAGLQIAREFCNVFRVYCHLSSPVVPSVRELYGIIIIMSTKSPENSQFRGLALPFPAIACGRCLSDCLQIAVLTGHACYIHLYIV